MNDTDNSSDGVLFPDWLRGSRRSRIAAAVLWAAAAAIYWLGMESVPAIDDIIVVGIFTALALFYLVRAVTDDARSQDQIGSCHWTWGW